jgi:phenylalanyl-tRNA synthetase beta chain
VKVSVRWLRDYVDTDLPPREIAERLTGAGIEVAEIAAVAEGLAGVVVAEIEAIEQELGPGGGGHQNRLVRVALPDRKRSVVCGAPNARPGLRTAFAPPGAVLPGGRRVDVAAIRGVTSEGMVCSERELGIGDDHRGVLELPADAPLGADLAAYLGLDDHVIEVEVTPNRPDALSVVGVAREVAALTGAALRPPAPAVRERDPGAAALASVTIEAPDLCPRFCARVITGLAVAPSPPWLQQRLRAVGLRPINNLVDVTNYVLWELGQPLHAFDYDAVAGHAIVVRRARPGERIVTLDGQERALPPDAALVCDPTRAIAVGGVMGGRDTEVTARTTAVLLEAAYWDPGSIRRTARALGLATDAAYRFERGADIEGLGAALDRAAALMAELGGGAVARGRLDVYPAPRPRPRLALRPARIERVIGASPPRDEVVRILGALGFGVDDAGEALAVDVPSFRRDVAQEDDLVEEVVRVWGYDRIPAALVPGGELIPVQQPADLALARGASRALNAAGAFEAVTYSFVDPRRLAAMGWDDPAALVALDNPMSQERSVLRPSLLPGLLEVVAGNAAHQTTDVAVFEVGTVFGPHRAEDGDRPAHEEQWLALALTGARHPRAWHAPRDRVDVYDAKGLAELVLAAAGAPPWEVAPLGDAGEPAPGYLVPGRSARLVARGRPVGWFGEVRPAAREAFELAAPVFAAELSLTALLALPRAAPVFRPLPRFPAVQRDLAVVVPAAVTAGAIAAHVRALDLPWLARIALFDVYTGAQVGPGLRSLAFGLTWQAPDRTLTDREVNELHGRVVDAIRARFQADVRGS